MSGLEVGDKVKWRYTSTRPRDYSGVIVEVRPDKVLVVRGKVSGLRSQPRKHFVNPACVFWSDHEQGEKAPHSEDSPEDASAGKARPQGGAASQATIWPDGLRSPQAALIAAAVKVLGRWDSFWSVPSDDPTPTEGYLAEFEECIAELRLAIEAAVSPTPSAGQQEGA